MNKFLVQHKCRAEKVKQTNFHVNTCILLISVITTVAHIASGIVSVSNVSAEELQSCVELVSLKGM